MGLNHAHTHRIELKIISNNTRITLVKRKRIKGEINVLRFSKVEYGQWESVRNYFMGLWESLDGWKTLIMMGDNGKGWSLMKRTNVEKLISWRAWEINPECMYLLSIDENMELQIFGLSCIGGEAIDHSPMTYLSRWRNKEMLLREDGGKFVWILQSTMFSFWRRDFAIERNTSAIVCRPNSSIQQLGVTLAW